jgi:hypothetical protein
MKGKLLASLAAAALTAAAFAAISVAQNGDSGDGAEGDVRAAPGAPPMFHHRIGGPPSEEDRAAMEEFRKCMEENGADLPEHPAPGEFRRGELPAPPKPPTESEHEAIDEALEACEDRLPEGAEFGIGGCEDDDGEDDDGEDEGAREESGTESGAESEGAAA